jgi:hypothetical protein
MTNEYFRQKDTLCNYHSFGQGGTRGLSRPMLHGNSSMTEYDVQLSISGYLTKICSDVIFYTAVVATLSFYVDAKIVHNICEILRRVYLRCLQPPVTRTDRRT